MYEQADSSQSSQTETKSNVVSQRKQEAHGGGDLENFGVKDNSSKTGQAAQLQAVADQFVSRKQPIQRKNNTGLPDNLKSGVENLSGYSMDDVKVHYNSDKPAQLQAHAYAQGNQIHIAPGQEKHLPHEAWHVVQQKQGRVRPTTQLKAKVNINDDEGLEKEADVMGAKAMQFKADSEQVSEDLVSKNSQSEEDPFQLVVNVTARQEAAKVVIKADGQASEFTGGDEAKNNGWNGVEKYKARAVIGDARIESGMLNNDYLNAQAGHVLAQQNGGLGSDPDNVFAQDGGVNNGYYRSRFENPMRAKLDQVAGDTAVSFRAVLYGDDISQGRLDKISDDIIASDEDSSGTSSDEDAEDDEEEVDGLDGDEDEEEDFDDEDGDEDEDHEDLTFEEWKNEIEEMAQAEYGMGLDDLPDEPYMQKYEDEMSPEDFYEQYMAHGKAL